MNIRT